MRHETISLEKTQSFSSFFIDYIREKEELKPFYSHFPSLENAKRAMDAKNFSQKSRQTLVQVLEDQYQHIEHHESVANNIRSLANDTTFTVTTGHQLNIFTGPLYFVYKLVSVINACKQLKKAYPDRTFVPIYWMASEDHDFEEINHFSFAGEKYQWQTDQTGAVGRMNPQELLEICKKLPSGAKFFQEAYSREKLADAVRYYVNYLFQTEGLVVVDADNNELKKALIPVIEDDLFVHSAEDLVSKTSASLHHLKYKTQVTPRQINFFYLDGDVRERIERNSGGFEVLETKLKFSEAEMRDMIANHPDRFSPNVVLRPLYQEMILPNIAYIGGPSEGIYWLQLKAVFDHFEVPFPLVMPRNFATIISGPVGSKWQKTGFSSADLYTDTDRLISRWVKEHTEKDLTFSNEIEAVAELERRMKKKAQDIDPTLVQHIEAIIASFSKKVHLAEKKLVRAEKRKHSEKRNQIEVVKEKLFPNGSLQERSENLLSFYLDDPAMIQSFLDTFDAFDYSMYLLWK